MAFKWFAVGVGIPLLALGLLRLQSNDAPALPIQVKMQASAGAVVEIPAITPDIPVEEIILLAPQPKPLFDTLLLEVSSGDTMERLFKKNNLSLSHLVQIANLEEAKARFRKIRPGDVFEVRHDDGQIQSLYSKLSLTSGLRVERKPDGFSARLVEHPIEVRKRMAHGVIDSSLYMSATDAGLSDKVIMNIAGIFAWDVDFVLDIRRGDDYYVQYEEIWQDGKYVSDGEIVAAEFNNRGRSIQAIRFVDDDKHGEYFTPDGKSVRKAFLRSPVDFRVSSSFNPNRLHPVLKTKRPHRGVDYAAPSGTPIKASGDGKVIFRGVKSGYGNVVILQHGGNITTLYAHMSRFASKVRSGTRVRQGQTIGYVGATGLVTGAHLHYEYRLNGIHRNPRTVALPDAAPIAEKYREKFMATAAPILQELEQYKTQRDAALAYNDRRAK